LLRMSRYLDARTNARVFTCGAGHELSTTFDELAPDGRMQLPGLKRLLKSVGVTMTERAIVRLFLMTDVRSAGAPCARGSAS
jgi:hypothetical protein